MASINKRANGRWQAQVRINGHSRSRTFAKRAEAVKWSRDTELKLDRCDYVDTRPLRTFTLGEILHRYSDEVCSTKKAGRNERYALEKLLRNSSISEQRLDRLSERVVSVWRDQWLQNLAPASVCRYLGLLQHALEVAMREWDIPLSENVVGSVRRSTLVVRPIIPKLKARSNAGIKL